MLLSHRPHLASIPGLTPSFFHIELPAPFLLHSIEISLGYPNPNLSSREVYFCCKSPEGGRYHGLGTSSSTRELREAELWESCCKQGVLLLHMLAASLKPAPACSTQHWGLSSTLPWQAASRQGGGRSGERNTPLWGRRCINSACLEGQVCPSNSSQA